MWSAIKTGIKWRRSLNGKWPGVESISGGVVVYFIQKIIS